jgi:hypothetical protein
MVTLSNESIERYRTLLTKMVELDKEATNEEIRILQSFLVEDTIYLATHLIKDMAFLVATQPKPTRFSRYLFLYLLNALYNSTKISEKDWQQLVGNCSFKLFVGMARNSSFPVKFLVSDNPFEEELASPVSDSYKSQLRGVIIDRLPEIVVYTKSTIPGSESMTDEMVLSVAGIKL